MEIDGLAVVSVDAHASKALNAGKITTDGSLKLNQANSIEIVAGNRVHTKNADACFDKLEFVSMSDFLMGYTAERNETTQYVYSSNI